MYIARLIVAGTFLLSACGNDSTECPFPASSCSEECHEVGAFRWNGDDECWHEPETLGCDSGDILEAVTVCIVRKSDGAAFLVFGVPPDSEEFALCTGEDTPEECAACLDHNDIAICEDPGSL